VLHFLTCCLFYVLLLLMCWIVWCAALFEMLNFMCCIFYVLQFLMNWIFWCAAFLICCIFWCAAF
jgi:hypothetical protein